MLIGKKSKYILDDGCVRYVYKCPQCGETNKIIIEKTNIRRVRIPCKNCGLMHTLTESKIQG